MHLFSPHHPNNIGERYASYTSLLCSPHHSPVNLSHPGPNIFLSTLFLNIHSLWSSFNAGDQVLHQNKIIYGGYNSKEVTVLKWRPETHPRI
jgi:hypothetical protein